MLFSGLFSAEADDGVRKNLHGDHQLIYHGELVVAVHPVIGAGHGAAKGHAVLHLMAVGAAADGQGLCVLDPGELLVAVEQGDGASSWVRL